MSSSIGDALNNPAIKAKSEPSNFHQLGNAMKRGAARNLDEILSPGDIPGKILGFLLKNLGPRKVRQFMEDMDKYESPGLVESGIKNAGLIEDLPEPTSYKGKLSRNLGYATSGLPYAAGGGLRSIAQALLGGASQSAAQPVIEEKLPSNPLVQFGANTLAGILGGTPANIGAKNTRPLPEYTSAQKAFMNNPNDRKTRELGALSEDLGKSFPEYSHNLQNLQLSQHKSFAKEFPKTNFKGSQLVKALEDVFSEGENLFGQEYKLGLNQIMEGMKNPDTKNTRQPRIPINTNQAFETINELLKEEPIGKGGLRSHLKDLEKRIKSQHNDPKLLHLLRKRLGQETQYPNLTDVQSSAKNAITNQIIHKLSEDLKEQIPGYREFMSGAEEYINKLKELKTSILGDVIKKGKKKPSEVIAHLFENADPEQIELIKKVVPPEILDETSKYYLSNLLKENVNKPLINNENKFQNWFNLRSKLADENLQAILPDHWSNFAKDMAAKIEASEFGLPRDDFARKVHRGVSSGNEIKGTGQKYGKYIPHALGATSGGAYGFVGGGIPGAIAGSIAGAGLGTLAKTKYQNLQSNKLLYDKSIPKQLLNSVSPKPLNAAIQSKIASNILPNAQIEQDKKENQILQSVINNEELSKGQVEPTTDQIANHAFEYPKLRDYLQERKQSGQVNDNLENYEDDFPSLKDYLKSRRK